MSFQVYLDNIKAKTGNDPDDFKRIAEQNVNRTLDEGESI